MQEHAYILYNKHIAVQIRVHHGLVQISFYLSHILTGDISQHLNVNLMCLTQCGTTERCSNQRPALMLHTRGQADNIPFCKYMHNPGGMGKEVRILQ
jgi:hypothetical protein